MELMTNLINNFPPGLGFTPSAEDLLNWYLPRKKRGEVFDPLIKDIDLYSNEPWNLFESNEEQSVLYIFTDLNKIGKKVQRRAGSGTWKGQNNKVVEDSHGNVIGFDRYFSFTTEKKGKEGERKKSDDDDKHGRWTMHEFAAVDERGHSVDDKVVCIIGHDVTKISTKNTAPKKRRRRGTGSDVDDEETITTTKRECLRSTPLSSASRGGVGVLTEDANGFITHHMMPRASADNFITHHMAQPCSSIAPTNLYLESGNNLPNSPQNCMEKRSSPAFASSGGVGASTRQNDESAPFDHSDHTHLMLQGVPAYTSLIDSEAQQPCSLSAAAAEEEVERSSSFDASLRFDNSDQAHQTLQRVSTSSFMDLADEIFRLTSFNNSDLAGFFRTIDSELEVANPPK